MKSILIWLVYEIDNSSVSNRLCNNFDYFLAFLYFLISVYNAVNCAYNIQLFDQEKNVIVNSITTFLVIAINIVILIRMYIKLHIQFVKEENNVKFNLCRNERYDKIVIEALEKRMSLIRNVWLICFIIIVFIWLYGNVVVNSVCAVAVVCALLTLFNDMVDIAVNKYSAKVKPGAIRYIIRR